MAPQRVKQPCQTFKVSSCDKIRNVSRNVMQHLKEKTLFKYQVPSTKKKMEGNSNQFHSNSSTGLKAMRHVRGMIPALLFQVQASHIQSLKTPLLKRYKEPHYSLKDRHTVCSTFSSTNSTEKGVGELI